jgi:glycosyltransferase involved in cell wall biosynthesis
MRILYIQASFVPPPLDLRADRFCLLSEMIEGDVLQPAWFRTPGEIEAVYGPGSWPVYTVGRFRYHWFLAFHGQRPRSRLTKFWFYLQRGLRIYRERPFECIVAYSHMTTALIAVLLKIVSGAKLIVEIVTSPEQVYLTERPRPGLRDMLKHLYSDVSLHLSLLMADRAHYLFPDQLSSYRWLQRVPNSVFHDFVPISLIDRCSGSGTEMFILLVGSPWYLKGVDLLIHAFRRLAPDFPDVKLTLLGHFPDQTALKALAEGSTQIEIMAAKPNPETLRFISKAAVMALPSRCEGLGRVLIEGMAAGVPLVGSDIGGIPFLIRDGENGFVVPCGDVKSLEVRLRQLISDPELRRKMGANGYQRAHSEFSEKVYVQQFASMIEAAVQGHS